MGLGRSSALYEMAYFDFVSVFSPSKKQKKNPQWSTALKAFNFGFTVSICFVSLDAIFFLKKQSTFHLKIYNLIFKKQV